MTNYNKWDSKASALDKELEEDEAREKAENDKACGIEGGLKGPPTAKAEQEREELDGHSNQRKEFIEWHKNIENEAQFTHKKEDTALVELTKEQVEGRSVRIFGSEGVKYIFPEGVGAKKIVIGKCTNCVVQVNCSLPTSTIEIFRCVEVRLELGHPLGTAQVDECTESFQIQYLEHEHVGSIYHQNCPGLAIGWGAPGTECSFFSVGQAGAFQLVTRKAQADGSAEQLATLPVRRGEGDYPIDMPNASGKCPARGEEPEQEAAPLAEERKRVAEQKRTKGNEMFRANDFMQAGLEYSQALELDPDCGPVWANRSQCWLKLGDPEKALADAIKCTEVDPTNAKGWFRKGMSLHATKRYGEAIGALLEAEKLDPKNQQIIDAIKMGQLMARKHGPDGRDT